MSRDAAAVGSVSLVYFDAIPWQLRVYLHTLRCSLNGQRVPLRAGGVFESVRLVPGEQVRRRPASVRTT